MRRIGVVACALACFALPGASRAATPPVADPPGYTPVGPAETLNTIRFASDGTIYGTVDATIVPDTDPLPPILWRSTDHGRTWRSAYRAPEGTHIILDTVSPADPGIVYVTQGSEQDHTWLVERIDARRGLETPFPLRAFPFGYFLGVDSAGTAYGWEREASLTGTYTLVRCRSAATTCDRIVADQFIQQTVVDPNSAGTLVTWNAARILQVSTDGGTSWRSGAQAAGEIGFSGPAPRTLVSLAAGQLSVSHDAGLTWASTRPIPAGATVVAGSRPSVMLGVDRGGPFALTGDGGATYRTIGAPAPGDLSIDPKAGDHFILTAGDQTLQSSDGGANWRDVADARFGMLALTPAGAGARLYAPAGGSIWFSGDRGATWSRTRRPFGETQGRAVVSRDDPLTAYAGTSLDYHSGEIRTRDGGATWQPVALPPDPGATITSIAPGDPLHVFSRTQENIWESADGGGTWTIVPFARQCLFVVLPDAASPTGKWIHCNTSGWDYAHPVMAAAPYAPGVVGSPEQPSVYAVVVTGRPSYLGTIAGDWSFSDALSQTGGFGPLPDSQPITAWPSSAGTTFYAWGDNSNGVWVRRGAGRWWSLRAPGQALFVDAALDATHALVRPAVERQPAAVLDLTHPAVAPPTVQRDAGGLTCAVPWTAAEADTSGLGWSRDGSALSGASDPQLQLAARDQGHPFTCRATASTDFGASTVESAAYLVPPAHASIRGVPRAGSLLRCGATARISWLRDGRALSGHHERSFRVRPRDRGHALACQTRRADGGIARSRDVHIAKKAIPS